MINKYLKELVENNNRIIIPDFGAFMVQSTPDGKNISFNDFLKFNDGLLVNQIIKAEKISKNDAADKVKEFVKSIEAAFSKGESFEVKELGFLVKDNNGNIKFEKELGGAKAEAPKTDAKPTIVLDEKKEDKNEETKPAAKKAEPKKETAAKAESKPAAKTAAKPVVKPETKTTTPTAPAAEKVVAPPKAQATPPKPAATPPKPQAKPVAAKPIAKPTPESKKTAANIMNKKQAKSSSSGGSKVAIIIIAAIIIIGGGGFAAWHFGLFDKQEPVVEVAPIPEPVIDTTPVVDTTVVIEEEPEPEVVEEPSIDPNAKRYYIVAGSFKIATNADNFNQKLIDEGYQSEIISRSNGFHTVSYKTLYDWNEALQEWQTMRNTDEQTWILVK